jgi:hypothetical protein
LLFTLKAVLLNPLCEGAPGELLIRLEVVVNVSLVAGGAEQSLGQLLARPNESMALVLLLICVLEVRFEPIHERSCTDGGLFNPEEFRGRRIVLKQAVTYEVAALEGDIGEVAADE